jgi:hypothetical protein
VLDILIIGRLESAIEKELECSGGEGEGKEGFKFIVVWRR